MKNIFVAAALVSLSLSHASAKIVACTGENFAKLTDRLAAMPYGNKRMAVMREVVVINSDLSNGDMGGACAHYAIAQEIQSNKRGPFEDLHQE